MITPLNGRGGPQRIPRPDDVRPGGPPPWAHLAPQDRRIDLDELVERIRGYEPGFANRGMPDRGHRSAVLVTLWESADGVCVLLTRRSPHMRSHTHEVSFPGGRHDDDDVDLWHTALREAHEEVALQPATVTRVGELDRFITGGSGSLVRPFVATLDSPPQNLVANPAEVEEILLVRLDELLLDEVWREEIWTRPDMGTRPITFFELYGDTVWGATGTMLRQLLTLATDPV